MRHLAFAALGWGYISWFLAHMVLINQNLFGGPGILLVLGLGVAMSDVGAFAVGKAVGRHKLSPRISPNKTWEGVGGNFLGAYLGVAVMWFSIAGPNFWRLALGLPVIIALGSVWGDLVESAIKREFEAKDAGAWLPGFGGILDRIDSLILVLPLAYYSIRLTT
jgi:phosphatidate cytidylyltransferase